MKFSRKQSADVVVTLAVFAAVWGLFEAVARMGGIGGYFTENASPMWYASLAIATALGRILIHRSFNKGVEQGRASS